MYCVCFAYICMNWLYCDIVLLFILLPWLYKSYVSKFWCYTPNGKWLCLEMGIPVCLWIRDTLICRMNVHWTIFSFTLDVFSCIPILWCREKIFQQENLVQRRAILLSPMWWHNILYQPSYFLEFQRTTYKILDKNNYFLTFMHMMRLFNIVNCTVVEIWDDRIKRYFEEFPIGILNVFKTKHVVIVFTYTKLLTTSTLRKYLEHTWVYL